MFADGSSIGRPTPIAAAIGSSINTTSRAPARIAESLTARRSTSVIPDGTATTILGAMKVFLRFTLPMK